MSRYVNGCLRKRRYTAVEAQAVIVQRRKVVGGDWRAKRCALCGCYHVMHRTMRYGHRK